jgi:hypothetical protein
MKVFRVTGELRQEARYRLDLIRRAQGLVKGIEGTFAGDVEIAALFLRIEQLEAMAAQFSYRAIGMKVAMVGGTVVITKDLANDNTL